MSTRMSMIIKCATNPVQFRIIICHECMIISSIVDANKTN